MARLLTDAQVTPSTSSTTADVMGEASEPRNKVQNVTPRRLSFKTRQTPSRNYRSTKVTLSSNNVSLIASKFNTIRIEDDPKGRALLRRLSSAQRKPLQSKSEQKNNTLKNVKPEGVVKAAIQIFEQQDEPDVPNTAKSSRSNLVLVRKPSSIKEQNIMNVITQNSAKEVTSAKLSEKNQLTKEAVNVEFQRKPSLKAKPQLRNLNRSRYTSDLGVNFIQRVEKFNHLDDSKIVINKNLDQVKNRRSLGSDISQRIEQFNINESVKFVKNETLKNTQVENITTEKKENNFNTEKENKTTREINGKLIKPVTLIDQTKERLALITTDSNTKPKLHPKPNTITEKRSSSLYNETFNTELKSLKIFKSPVILQDYKESDNCKRLSIPKDPTILEHVFDSDEPIKNNEKVKTVGSLGRPNNSFLWKSNSLLCVTEIPIIDEIDSDRKTDVLDVRNIKQPPSTKPKNGFKTTQISIVNGINEPLTIKHDKSLNKPQISSFDDENKSVLNVFLNDDNPNIDDGLSKEKITNSFNIDVANSFISEMNEQIDKRFNCDFSNYEIIYNKTDENTSHTVVNQNKSTLYNSGLITETEKSTLVAEKPSEKQKSSEDLQKLLVEELTSRNFSSLHMLAKRTESETNPSPKIPPPTLTRNRSPNTTRVHLIPIEREGGISKIPPPVLRHLKKTQMLPRDSKVEDSSSSEEYFSSKFSQYSDHYTLVGGDEDVGDTNDSEAYEDVGEQENSYAVIKEYEDERHNIYDDVLNMHEQVEDHYEAINPVITNQPDSDSSCEQTNSLYGLRPSSRNSSAGGGVYQLTGLGYQPTPRSETSDEWMDMDNSDDQNEQILVYREKDRPTRTWSSAGGWSQKVRRQWSKRASSKEVGVKSTSNIYVLGLSDENVIHNGRPTSPTVFNGYTKGLVSLRTILYFGHTYEAQEVSLYLGKEDGSDGSSPHPYEYVEEADDSTICDDFDDSFDSDTSVDDATEVRPQDEKNSRGLPEPPRDGIYGFMKQAGKRMRKHWSLGKSLRRISKISVGTAPTHQSSYDQGRGNSSGTTLNRKRWPSFKSKFKPPVQNQSMFYLTTANEDSIKQNVSEVTNYSESRVDPRRLSTASMIRPSSPPPPPPPPRNPTCDPSKRSSFLDESGKKTSTQSDDAGKKMSTTDDAGKRASLISNLTKELISTFDKTDFNSTYAEGQQRLTQTSNSNWYLDISWPSTDSASEHGSSQGSDFHLTFADEPLYQFYTANIAEMSRSELNCDDSDGYEEIASLVNRPSAMDLITPHHRTLWCEIPEVKNSGILDQLTPSERKLQEAKFEVMTSEASYFKSLTVLDKHFASCPIFADETILPSQDKKILFSNVSTVRKCSEKLLAALEKCWQNNILLSGICKILYDHIQTHFYIYVKYCSNQIYLDKTLKRLKSTNTNFNDILTQLEGDSQCQSLSLHSFLMLPMQRVTRMPLLVDAILSRLSSTDPEFTTCEILLATLNKYVTDCNEGARRQERYEEMLKLSQQLEFCREVRTLPVLSPSRWLVRSGQLTQVNMDAKLTFGRRLARTGPKITLFLFTDLLVVAKKKGDDSYLVVDYCQRNLVQMSDMKDITGNNRYLLILTMLENHEMKTVELMLCCESETVRQRWLQAVTPPVSSNPDETLYEDWDCPQVSAIHVYSGGQPDELSLQPGDVVNVFRKMADGWYYGERMRDGETGWFPANHSVEIASMHVRAKNLKQRWRFLALSGNYVKELHRKSKI